MKVILENISSVRELYHGLGKLPSDTKISPFGSSECKLVYDEKNKVAYIDDNFDFLDEGEIE